MAITVIHTADLHLDAETQVLSDVFISICESAQKEHIDFLLIAGDLFDTAVPDERTLSLVRRAFGNLVHTRVVYIPGNHDAFPETIQLSERN